MIIGAFVGMVWAGASVAVFMSTYEEAGPKYTRFERIAGALVLASVAPGVIAWAYCYRVICEKAESHD